MKLTGKVPGLRNTGSDDPLKTIPTKTNKPYLEG